MKNYWLTQRTSRIEKQKAKDAHDYWHEFSAKREAKRAAKQKSELPPETENATALDKSISLYFESNPNDWICQSEITGHFEVLAENILKSLFWRWLKDNNLDGKTAKEEMVKVAWEKLRRFDHKSGKAFNFFTTVMLGHLRGLYLAQKKRLTNQ